MLHSRCWSLEISDGFCSTSTKVNLPQTRHKVVKLSHIVVARLLGKNRFY